MTFDAAPLPQLPRGRNFVEVFFRSDPDKTDRYFTVDEMQEYALAAVAAFKPFGTYLERDDGTTEFRRPGQPFTPTAQPYRCWTLYAPPSDAVDPVAMQLATDGPAAVGRLIDAGAVVSWAVDQWLAQVKDRPLVNVHRRSLDDCWRQVMRKYGGDPDSLVGPSHDDLVSLAAAPSASSLGDAHGH